MSATLANTFAPLPTTKRGSNILPGVDPKGETASYTCGSVVVMRNLQDPSKAELFTGHSSEATIARWAPSGFYVASADVSGKVKIWDTTQKEHAVKYEYQPLSGAVKDLAWSDDSKRVVVGGEGRERFGAVFLWDSGSSVGEITGHSKPINSVDIKPNRPYRVVTASEDCQTAFFQGPPFRFVLCNKDHTRFVNCVRYAPDGSTYVTGSSDGRVYLYDGKTGEKKGELGSPAHSGSVMGLAWRKDSQQLLTASADKTAKLWSVTDMSLTCTFNFGNKVEDQQLGCIWAGDDIITVSLSGYLNYLDPANPAAPRLVVQGHNKAITAMSVDVTNNVLFTADHSGRIVKWDVPTCTGTTVGGEGHSNQVTSMAIANETLWSVGMDDVFMSTGVESTEYRDNSKTATNGCPHGIAAVGETMCLVTVNGIEAWKGGERCAAVSVEWSPLCVALQRDGVQLAVGDANSTVHIFTLDGNTLVESQTLSAKGQVTCVAFSPDGQHLACGDSGRNVSVWSVPAYEKVISDWTYHTAKVTCLAWAPSSLYIVSGGIDTNVFVWSLERPNQRIQIRNAHVGSVNCVDFLAEDTIVSAGQEAAIKTWTLEHSQ